MPTKAFQMTLPAPCARNASIRWTTPAKTISHATTTFTATAGRNGEPTAIMPNTISKTPHKTETVEPLFTISTGVFCAIEASLISGHKRTPKSLEIEERAQFGGMPKWAGGLLPRKKLRVEPRGDGTEIGKTINYSVSSPRPIP